MFDWSVFLLVSLISLSAGATTAFLLWRFAPEEWQITLREYVVGSLVILLAVAPLTTWAASTIAKNAQIGDYIEFQNGSVVSATRQDVECEYNGSCQNHYDCDPYLVPVTTCTSDDKGNMSCKTTLVTRYNSCPYATVEHNFYVSDSLGDRHTIALGWLDEDPEVWSNESNRQSIPDYLQLGVPAYWQQAYDSIMANRPLPVTKIITYDNYILADDQSLLKAYNDAIEEYKSKGWLPDHTQNLKNPVTPEFTAKKFNFVGETLPNDEAWQDAVNRLNAKLSMTLQGDLHVVAIDATKVSLADSEKYTNTLLAYWQSDTYGKKSLARNTIVLVIGVQDGKVDWSRAKTGVPLGNDSMLSALSSRLAGQAFAPDTLIGSPGATIVDGKPQYQLSQGLVDQIITVDYPFERPCTDCANNGESGGFVYIKPEVHLSFWSKFWTGLSVFVLTSVIWILLARLEFFPTRKPE